MPGVANVLVGEVSVLQKVSAYTRHVSVYVSVRVSGSVGVSVRVISIC